MGRVLAGGSGGVLGDGAPDVDDGAGGARGPAGRHSPCRSARATSNHTLFAAAVASTRCSSALAVLDHSRPALSRSTASTLFGAFAPAVRWSLVAFYFFAAFHKLNSDWFDPSVSCGALFYAREREVFPFLPASNALRDRPRIHGSLAFEMAIPMLLAFRPTRHLGVLTGMVFHWILATNPLSGFYNFSSMLFAVFALFLSGPFVSDAAELLGRRPREMDVVDADGRPGRATRSSRGHSSKPVVPSSRDMSSPRLVCVRHQPDRVRSARSCSDGRSRSAAISRSFVLPQPVLAVVPLLVFLNGAAPR